ncbi:hypothetical protein [Microvirga roseola]|uniref:hypothetical protein n=1 Tax=Microvirga roseola TaxID=2883126 RepID=UPI001E599BBA|nr:hypothetical protein [Microvirga roseola]
MKELDGVQINRVIYSRFFLHAINALDEHNFFNLCNGLLPDTGIIAVEFRTTRDEQLLKATPDHYRRYINPLELAARAQLHGFGVDYFVEGFGYAKFRADDAYVARMIFSRRD